MLSNKKIFKNQYFSAGIEEDGELRFTGKNALGFAWRPGQDQFDLLIDSCTIDGQGVAEGLKLSFCSNVIVSNSIIIGGYEDCVDIVRGDGILFDNCTFFAGERTSQHVTIKGGAKQITFNSCKFVNSFRNWWDGACIDLGNWTDYDDVHRPKVRDVKIINCSMKEVEHPILYRRLYSETPQVKNSPGLRFNAPEIFVKLFWYGQRKGLFGKRRRFTKEWLKVYNHEL